MPTPVNADHTLKGQLENGLPGIFLLGVTLVQAQYAGHLFSVVMSVSVVCAACDPR